MPNPELLAGKHVVDGFAHRLDERIHDLVIHGGFLDVYRSLDRAIRQRAVTDPHPVVATIVTDMLMQFLSYHDRETLRHTPQEQGRLSRGF
jgi:hypothetical protein